MKVLGVVAQFRKLEPGESKPWKYITTAPAVFTLAQPIDTVPSTFSNAWVTIERAIVAGESAVIITIAEKYAWDGDSVVPDADGTLEASMLHDIIYQFADDIAAEYHWTVMGTLAWANNCYYAVMSFCKAPLYVRVIYRTGVGLFGYIYNRGHKLWRWLTTK